MGIEFTLLEKQADLKDTNLLTKVAKIHKMKQLKLEI